MASESRQKRWIVRPTALEDEEAINVLLKSSFETLLQPHYNGDVLKTALPLITKTRKELLTCGTWYVAEDPADRSIVGCGGWTPENPPKAKDGLPHLRHFATDPKVTRQGVARAIWGRIWQDVRSKMGPCTSLEVFSTLTAKAFYESLGFVEVDTLELPLADDCLFPCILMRRKGTTERGPNVVGLLGLSACSASVDRFQTAFVRSMSTKTTSSSKEWLVRPSTLDDEEEINKLLGLSYGKLLTADYDAKLLAKSLPVLTTSKKELLTCGTWYVAQDMMDHSIVGCGGWTERNPFNESVDCPQLRHFATHPDAIRQGVGRAIWNRVWEDVSNKLGPATPLAVFSTLGAKAFYESIGFVEVERMCVELADDCMFPGIMMRREGNIG